MGRGLHTLVPSVIRNLALKRAENLSERNEGMRLVMTMRAKLFLQLPGLAEGNQALDAAITANSLTPRDQPEPLVKRFLALAHLRNDNWIEFLTQERIGYQLGHRDIGFAVAIVHGRVEYHGLTR